MMTLGVLSQEVCLFMQLIVDRYLIPPIKLYDKGVLNEAALKIVTRNSRLEEHLSDLDAEMGAACLALEGL